MCGRYTLVRIADLTEIFPWVNDDLPEVPPRYNIAPTQPILAIANDKPDKYDFFYWGLVPPWAKDTSIGARMINARGETLGSQSAFRNAYRRRRCLIPADGFYEWKKSPDSRKKTPMHIRMRSGKPFAFGGLWETWSSPDGSQLRSCTIVTTKPNELMATMHDRMPVIIPPEAYREWLDAGERSPGELDKLLVPYREGELEATAVSTFVNSAKNDGPACIAPPDEEPPATSKSDDEPTLFG
jgi:putative SOS response-associated peptidase YedK